MAWNGLDQRKFPRAVLPCLIVLRSGVVMGNIVLTHTENIGGGGVCICLREAVPRLSVISLEIDLMDGGDPVRCPGKVVWSIQRKKKDLPEHNFFDTGIEFESLSEEDRLRVEKVVNKLINSVSDKHHS